MPVELAQTELAAVIVEFGIGFTTTVVMEAGEMPQLVVRVTEYVPALTEVALAIVGFCALEVKPFGPDQLYVSLALPLAVSEIVWPTQKGPPLPAVVVGDALMVAEALPVED